MFQTEIVFGTPVRVEWMVWFGSERRSGCAVFGFASVTKTKKKDQMDPVMGGNRTEPGMRSAKTNTAIEGNVYLYSIKASCTGMVLNVMVTQKLYSMEEAKIKAYLKSRTKL